MTRRSLGARMVLLFGALLAGIGVFMVLYFPARMAEETEQQAEQRARSIVQVMSTALGPAVEFEDAEHATEILGWLGTAPDVTFALVEGAGRQRLAAWHPEHIPQVLDHSDDTRVISIPIRGHADGQGLLHVGFSLAPLAEERAEARDTVALVSALVFGVGLLGTLLFATIVVRPIRALSWTARRIASGKLPPVMPEVDGGDEVSELAASLRAMLEKVHHESQQELVRASRHAGMAEVATGVLHNVGNVLTSVNVSLELLRERTGAMPVDRLRKLHELLGKAPALDKDRLAITRNYVAVVTEAFEQFQHEAGRDLEGLGGHVDHIKRVVAMQNAYARVRSAVESTRTSELLSEAIELGCRRRDLAVSVIVAPELARPIAIDRHRVLQVLVNLLANARDAVAGRVVREIRVEATREGANLVIAVTDNGVGISPEHLQRVFGAGFTSKPHGHGYGLHSSALTARQLGGTLAVHSEGEGCGARFTLTVPIEEAA